MKHRLLTLYSRCLFVLLGIGFIVNIRILSHWTALWFPSVRVTCSVSHDLREREAVPVEEKKPLLRDASPIPTKKPDLPLAANVTDSDAIPVDFRVPSW